MNLFRSASAISNFPAVHRIFQYSSDQCRIEQRIFPVLSWYLTNTMIFKIFCKSVCPYIRMHILVKNHTDCFCFFLIDKELPFFQTVSIRCKTTVPFTLTGFLDSALHGLHPDIFTLNLCNRRQDGNHQFSGILGRINPILHADQIDTKILHHLQSRKDIRSISAKS